MGLLVMAQGMGRELLLSAVAPFLSSFRASGGWSVAFRWLFWDWDWFGIDPGNKKPNRNTESKYISDSACKHARKYIILASILG